jgi:hypothetical protein
MMQILPHHPDAIRNLKIEFAGVVFDDFAVLDRTPPSTDQVPLGEVADPPGVRSIGFAAAGRAQNEDDASQERP